MQEIHETDQFAQSICNCFISLSIERFHESKKLLLHQIVKTSKAVFISHSSVIIPAVDEVWSRVEGHFLHGIRVVFVLSSHDHPLFLSLILKHHPLLRRTHQQNEVRCNTSFANILEGPQISLYPPFLSK